MAKEVVVIIVGCGPSGISTSACLNKLSIPNVVLEREDCLASLWKKRCYNRMRLHGLKRFSQFPHMPIPDHYPQYMSKNHFLQYVEDYAVRFKVNPLYNRDVELAVFDGSIKKWCVKVKNTCLDGFEEYVCNYLVVATGENSDAFVPEIEGLDSFGGEVLHSTKYKSGAKYVDKNVLVVGSGNSGMEIALDLANFGAKAFIIFRSPVHILSRDFLNLGFFLKKYIPLKIVDALLAVSSKLIYGDTHKYGISRPNEGPFSSRWSIDVGTFDKIKSGDIQVLPSLQTIRRDRVEFSNGESYQFNVIVFATGFRRSASKWLKDAEYILNENENSKLGGAKDWKGENGLYCVGLCAKGIEEASTEAVKIADDIKTLYSESLTNSN
ncbi:hypothetical protein MKW98_015827 [Papaver atlanticum]|uniref:Flavin-containing monooxygenase n=1 Tax=Papaver atlanticum TaxID=357466 RepID=A0AAD4XV99_9MAGN|nr:hypothetical protein MKW98_015827 [Papaver atlanticum]